MLKHHWFPVTIDIDATQIAQAVLQIPMVRQHKYCKSDAWFDTCQLPCPSTRELLEAERPFDAAYADAIDKLSRMDYKEDTIALFDKEMEDLHDQIQSRIPQSV
ncbi:hypothetical protein M405DRAFT_870095 [Rhizopogon salebrosus TDB-379]|nr:hypothetical protein M405DRAFT_870095 [Rhizopogon salebrosus TDB-379]